MSETERVVRLNNLTLAFIPCQTPAIAEYNSIAHAPISLLLKNIAKEYDSYRLLMQQINSAVAFAISQSPEGNHMKPLAIPLLFLTVSAGFSAFAAAQQTNTEKIKKWIQLLFLLPVNQIDQYELPIRHISPAKRLLHHSFLLKRLPEATAAYVTFAGRTH